MKIDYVKKGLVVGIISLLILITIPTIISINTIKNSMNFTVSPVYDNLVITVTTDKTKYLVGEPVVVTVWIKNTGNEDITIVFPDTQLTDFLIYKDEKIIYQWSTDKYFAQILTPVTIPSGTTVKLFKDEWEQIDSDGNQVPVGNYEIREWMVWAINHPEIYADPVYIRIGPHNKIFPKPDGLYGFRVFFIYSVFAYCHYFCAL